MTFSFPRRALLGALIGGCLVGDAVSAVLTRRGIIISRCSRVIDDYGAYIAGFKKLLKAAALQREFAHCAVAIEDYDDRRR